MSRAIFVVLGVIATVFAAPFFFIPLKSKGELCDASNDLARGKAIVPVLQGQTCSEVLGESKEYFCSFEFPFRSEAAKTLYDEYVDELKVCYNWGEYAGWTVSAPVNHPDSYAQTTFDHYKGAQFSVALKDKGALQKTYVFVRLPAN